MTFPAETHSLASELSDRQLAAYNAADLEAFCACYHQHVRVLDEDGNVTCEGMEAFRVRYATFFGSCSEVRAAIRQRIALGRSVVELEVYQRRPHASDLLEEGEVIVRYTERDGLIAIAQFIKA